MTEGSPVSPVVEEGIGLDVSAYIEEIPGPEIVELMDRLMQPSLGPLDSTARAPSALVVTRSADEDLPFTEALRDDGWVVLSCSGPGQGGCPLMRNERCPMREIVDVAVVFVDGSNAQPGLAAIPRIRCAADPSSPGMVVMEGRSDAAAYAGFTGTIGARRGPGALLDAIDTVLEGAASR